MSDYPDTSRFRLGMRLTVLARRWRQTLDEHLATVGFSDATWTPLSYLARRGGPASVADLAGHDLIGAMGPRATTEWQLASTRWRLDPRPRLVMNTVDGLLAAAEAGQGIANLLSYQVADALDAGRLIALLRDEQPPVLPVHLLFEPSRAGLPAVRLFIAAMKQRARMKGLV